jgi:hypothetical protein
VRDVAGRGGETNARALPPLAAFICERPDAGSRMSREAHVRFCERGAVAKFRRATRLIVFSAKHLRRILAKYAAYYNEVRTHVSLGKDAPARAQSSSSETLSPIRSSAGYTIDMHESDFSEATASNICQGRRPGSSANTVRFDPLGQCERSVLT